MTKQTTMITAPLDDKIVTKAVTINAAPATVWAALTEPALMQQWMAESPIEIITDWQVGHRIVIRGDLHGLPFENYGQVLQFDPARLLHYSHLSSVSNLPATEAENYASFAFHLTPLEKQTLLTFTARNFPTEAIYKHLAFYWTVALEVLKRRLEQPGEAASV